MRYYGVIRVMSEILRKYHYLLLRVESLISINLISISQCTGVKFCVERSKFSDSQAVNILRQAEAGKPAPELCRA